MGLSHRNPADRFSHDEAHLFPRGSQAVDHNQAGIEAIKLEYSLRLKIKRIDWLLADMCPQAANHCTLF